MNQYFTPNECENIIFKEFFDGGPLFKIEKCGHGKSSYIFFVHKGNESFTIKFPRTKFQAKNLIYEKQMTSLLKNKFSVTIPNMRLNYYLNKIYAVYNYIDGNNMSDVTCGIKDIDKLSLQLAELIYRFSFIDVQSLSHVVKSKEKLLIKFCEDFHYTPKIEMISDIMKENVQLIHGDFHQSNILLDKGNNICGLLDFSTISIGSVYFDLGHMCFSKNRAFNDVFLGKCEETLKLKIDREKIERMEEFLDDLINKHYLPYINSF